MDVAIVVNVEDVKGCCRCSKLQKIKFNTTYIVSLCCDRIDDVASVADCDYVARSINICCGGRLAAKWMVLVFFLNMI